MTPLERAGYLAHARTAGFQRREEQARACIREALRRCQRPYVAWSGGKDSTALLWLVLQEWPDALARIMTSGETRLLHGEIDWVMRWWRERYPALRLVELRVDRVFSAEWQDADWDTQRRAGRGDLGRVLTQDAGGVLMGLRAEESNRRRLAVSRRLPGTRLALRQCADGLLHANPLADWTTPDVGALIAREELPLLQAYAAGLHARTTARLTGDAVREGALPALRRRDPEAFNRLLTRFPELAWWSG